MLDEVFFSRVPITNRYKMGKIQTFLTRNGLDIDDDVEYFVVGKHVSGPILACGAIAGKVLKSVAIDKTHRGSGLSLTLMTELTNFAYELGRYNLFLFTKPQNFNLFRQSGFFPLAQVDDAMVLMENSPNRFQSYCQQLKLMKVAGDRIGGMIMNANPFTLGHQYLVEKACAECDWVHLFVVREEGKDFSYLERLSMIRAGTQHLKNVTVHPGSDYMISRATFPTYFIKDQKKINYCHAALDLQLFRDGIVPALGITHRYVGTEPLCPVTNHYNESMHYWLASAVSRPNRIDIIEVPRKAIGGEPVSASRVRRLLSQQHYEQVAKLVPTTTYQILLSDDVLCNRLKSVAA
ncbi:[citrate (pro-3S)-lyase] ligase [Vibrio spartinae]|uniref:[Citrate [pro-3S]-lyase] ligase n=1 Tax=Vibrio spartinae TaxID=1918945 RepID=A0A1N6M354_9VIBR|nr:[citrate (pro-3S)-lyase] ligase [Vibrio spartinae]QMV14379.1 [Citrate [pro-3S]-lyase] ligase [Vibrio spartinae]SIO93858.1 [Citrate [pro-3S]-lyase] ligase [Vibrio spartinae]